MANGDRNIVIRPRETQRFSHGVETQNFASLQTARIDLSHYAAGVYFVKAMADDNVIAVRKVVKQ